MQEDWIVVGKSSKKKNAAGGYDAQESTKMGKKSMPKTGMPAGSASSGKKFGAAKGSKPGWKPLNYEQTAPPAPNKYAKKPIGNAKANQTGVSSGNFRATNRDDWDTPASFLPSSASTSGISFSLSRASESAWGRNPQKQYEMPTASEAAWGRPNKPLEASAALYDSSISPFSETKPKKAGGKWKPVDLEKLESMSINKNQPRKPTYAHVDGGKNEVLEFSAPVPQPDDDYKELNWDKMNRKLHEQLSEVVNYDASNLAIERMYQPDSVKEVDSFIKSMKDSEEKNYLSTDMEGRPGLLDILEEQKRQKAFEYNSTDFPAL